MTIGLTAAGYDASSVLGHNLLAHIYNSKSIENQGINAYVYGLLALDTRPYEVPQDALYTREKLVQLILESQLDDGSFCYAPEWGSDIDLTAIAIQALAPYYTQENVKIAVDKATAWLSSIQLQNGGFESWGEESSESLAQVICAVTSLGRDPETDPEFTKPQGSLMAHLLTFYDEAENGFKHTTNGEVDFDYATPQAAYALVAASRYKSGKSALYDMSDLPALKVIKKDTQAEKELLNKKENVISYLEANTNFTTSYEKGSNRDWSVLALARMGQQIPSEYAEGIGAFIGSFKDETELLNTLSTPTEFARMTIGLTAAGYDASHVAQHDLVRNIYNNKGLEAQGINALIYGLIALDTKPYEVPQDALYTREKLVQLILKAQFSDGSFGYAPEWGSDIDLTAMAIQALAPYRNDAVVKEAIDKALSWLSQQQLSDGGFMSYGSESCESVAQVICALTSVGKNPATEAAFIKAGGSLLSNFLSFYDETTNGFKHSSNDSASLYTTQQASYALAAYIRAVNGEKPLYDMSDIGQYKKIALKVYTIDQNEAQTIKIEDNKADVLINQKEQNVTATLDVSNCKDALPQIQLKDGDDHYKIVIPKSTQITAGTTKLLLPTQVKDQGIVSQIQKITGSGQSVSKIIQHIELGSKKESIQFNNKIKVIFKNAAGNQVAYKDHLGKVYAIKKLQADADKSKYNEVCYDLGKDLVVETNHLTEYIVYGVKDNTPSGGVNNPGTVNISVERKTIGLSDLYNGTVNYESGDTVYSVLVKTGLSIEGSSNYVTGINGLKERDEKYGKGSGWMVTVNGSFINSAVGQYKVSPGDTIRWQYTCNYGKDLGSTVGTNDGNILGTGSAANALDAAKKLANTLSDKEDLSLWQILTLIQDKQKVAESYKKAIIEEVKNNQGHYRKVTDIEKTVLALTSLGVDCTDVEGYNLIEKIYNNEDLLKQGSNGLIFALIAVDSKDYKIPNDAKWTREKMKEKLISLQNKDGGFSLVEGETSDIDITAMALQALAPYKDEASSKKVIERAINYLSNIQKENGEFEAYGEENCESLAQVIIALTSLNIDPAKDARFIKNGRNLLDVLMDYQVDDSNFCHKKNGGNDKLATEQAFMALVSYKRYQEGKSGLYNLKDIKFTESAANNQENGTQENKKELGQFTDAAQVSTWAKEELQEAVNEGIISGYGDSLKPQKEVTRAEFTVMLMRVLAVDQNSPSSVSGNESSSENIFKDVNDSNWFAKEVTSAYQKGLVTGMGDKMFKPNNEITREQAAVMLAKLVTNAEEVQSVEFKDKNHIAEWAKPSVKIVYSSSILKGYADGSFKPKVAMSREAAAVTLLRLKKSLNQN